MTKETKSESWFDEFYELYDYGRKNEKSPQGYIDYFKARHFISSQKQKDREMARQFMDEVDYECFINLITKVK